MAKQSKSAYFAKLRKFRKPPITQESMLRKMAELHPNILQNIWDLLDGGNKNKAVKVLKHNLIDRIL